MGHPFRMPVLGLVGLLASCDASGPAVPAVPTVPMVPTVPTVPTVDDELGAPIDGPCSRHADCDSDVCDVYRPTGLGPGSCVAESSVLYVDQAACDPDAADGSRGAPLCSIREAVALAGPGRPAIRVYPGLYAPFGVTGQAIAVYGPDPGGEAVEVTEEDVSGVQVGPGARVVLDGLVLGRHSRFGVRCTGTGAAAGATTVDVRRSEVLSDVGVAFPATGCDVRLDRAFVGGLFGGLQLTDSRYLVTNSVFTGTGERAAVSLSGGSGLFSLSTVTGNGDPDVPAAAVQCLTPARLEDSIVFGNASATGSQFAGSCQLRRTVVGSAEPFASPGAIRKDPDLDGYSLPRTPANLDCCIDRAPIRPLIRSDVEGTPRPQGPRFDIGADEADAS